MPTIMLNHDRLSGVGDVNTSSYRARCVEVVPDRVVGQRPNADSAAAALLDQLDILLQGLTVAGYLDNTDAIGNKLRTCPSCKLMHFGQPECPSCGADDSEDAEDADQDDQDDQDDQGNEENDFQSTLTEARELFDRLAGPDAHQLSRALHSGETFDTWVRAMYNELDQDHESLMGSLLLEFARYPVTHARMLEGDWGSLEASLCGTEGLELDDEIASYLCSCLRLRSPTFCPWLDSHSLIFAYSIRPWRSLAAELNENDNPEKFLAELLLRSCRPDIEVPDWVTEALERGGDDD